MISIGNDVLELDACLGCSLGGEKRLKFSITITDRMIAVRPEGYGEYAAALGFGAPIVVEQIDGVPRVLAWPDIKEQDPVLIDLRNAKEQP